MPQPAKLIGSVERALAILETFDDRTPELGTTEIAQATGLRKSTAAGLIYTLAAKGYLSQNPTTRKYRLGLRVLGLAKQVLGAIDLRQVALPHLHRLRNQFDETVNLAVPDDGHVMYLERLLCSHGLGMRSEVGRREPAHATALGKAILAFSEPAEVQTYVARYGLKPSTARSISDAVRFEQDLAETRQRGFAVDDEENEVGGRCVAAPIFDHRGTPVAAVSISAPVLRLPDSQLPVLGSRVREVAGQISTSLGYLPYAGPS